MDSKTPSNNNTHTSTSEARCAEVPGSNAAPEAEKQCGRFLPFPVDSPLQREQDKRNSPQWTGIPPSEVNTITSVNGSSYAWNPYRVRAYADVDPPLATHCKRARCFESSTSWEQKNVEGRRGNSLGRLYYSATAVSAQSFSRHRLECVAGG